MKPSGCVTRQCVSASRQPAASAGSPGSRGAVVDASTAEGDAPRVQGRRIAAGQGGPPGGVCAGAGAWRGGSPRRLTAGDGSQACRRSIAGPCGGVRAAAAAAVRRARGTNAAGGCRRGGPRSRPVREQPDTAARARARPTGRPAPRRQRARRKERGTFVRVGGARAGASLARTPTAPRPLAPPPRPSEGRAGTRAPDRHPARRLAGPSQQDKPGRPPLAVQDGRGHALRPRPDDHDHDSCPPRRR